MTEPTTPPDLAFLAVSAPDGSIRRIAHRFTPKRRGGAGPTIVFLPGYMSDMAGSKATALFEAARKEGRACLLLDYSGCGLSEGSFAEGTLTRWRDEVVALIAATCRATCSGRVLLVGSSMGGWLMLLVALALAEGAVPGASVAALVGIAAAPDFTEWGTSEADKLALAAGQTVLEDNPYGPEPTPTHPGFWADGQARLLLNGEIPLDCPVRLLHGQADPDVPWEIALRLAAALRSGDVQVTLVKDGDHRLSREADIALILATVSALTDQT
jgi:pimeloyl-ACP methyl ester carboxylesterase